VQLLGEEPVKSIGLSLIDAHIHLADSAYAKRIDFLLEVARKENVVALVANSMDLETSKASVALSVRNPSLVYAAVGMHPWNAQTADSEEANQIRLLVQDERSRIVAIGEIGLDKSYAKAPNHFEQQRRFFENQLDLAKRMNLPVIVHSRSSAKEVLDILNSYDQKKVLMHWYSGPLEYVKHICDSGWALSFGPSILYSKRIREIISKVPLESLLTETDGPVKYRGPFVEKETTPEFIRPVVEEVASILNKDPHEVADQILENFRHFFGVGEKAF
jgi:TatD DNase family protein